MMIPLIDAILLIIISGFVFYGFFFGLIRTFGSLMGVIVASILASRFYLAVADWAEELFFGYESLGKVMIFIILFSLIHKLVSFAFYLLDRAFNIISIIPFLKTFNKLGGAILGFVVGGLTLGLMLYVSGKYSMIDNWFGKWLVDSMVAPYLVKFANILLPLLPEMLKKIEGLI